MMRRFGAAGAATACSSLLILLSACHREAASEAAGPMLVNDHGLLVVPSGSPLRTHLEMAPVAGGSPTRLLALPAAVEPEPSRVTNILTPLAGRVTSVKIRLGQRVRAGEVLALVASGDLAQANADVEKAQDALDVASKALERTRAVRRTGGLADKDLEAAQSAYNQAKSELERAQTRLTSLNGSGNVRGRELILSAPQAGVVTALNIAPGVQVSDPTATLMTVTNIDQVFVTANVAEGDISQIPAGAAADISFTAYPGQTTHGRVSEVDALLQPDTRRQKVRVILDNPGGRLLPNMYAIMTVAAPTPVAAQGVWVPQSALIMNNEAISVMVEIRPWVFQRRPVQIADETDNAARVVSGLAPGERVVVRGGVLLND
jgi:cobalt-zinc-cadmium efflux system membrane fusion protein